MGNKKNPYGLKEVTMDEMICAVDPELPAKIREIKKQRTMGTALTRMRVSAGMSQVDMARAMNCTQSRISKLEMSENGKITLFDVIQYSRITGQKTVKSRLAEDEWVTLNLAFA